MKTSENDCNVEIILSHSLNKKMINAPNNQKIAVTLTPRGAAICRFMSEDRKKRFQNIALSLSTAQRYGKDPSFAGATIGPVAGRIRDACLPINGKQYRLTQNDGKNHLHGGAQNISQQVWDICSHDNEHVVFALTLPDGQDGYPGERHLTVTYTLVGQSLTITYRAQTTKPTYLSLSNHTYWNLSGDFASTALSQHMWINSNRVCRNDEMHLPVKIIPVSDTPFDFRTATSFTQMQSHYPNDPQLAAARGWNHAFALCGNPAAYLDDRISGRRLTIETDYPALVVYTGGFLAEDTLLDTGCQAIPSCAIALEAQDFPDAPHLDGAPYQLLMPGDNWEKTIRFTVEVC